MADLTGQTFDGFEILSKLGQGGMGAVYKARQLMLNRVVALKVMAPQLSADPNYVARFVREAAAAANLNHPNMVQVYTAGEHDDVHFIAMEFVEGESLQKRLNRLGLIEPREAVAVTIYVAQALQYAWNKARLIHRDIKPDNIFLSNTGEVKVGDLGLAKSVDSEATELTQSGTAMGSPHYISPEQATGQKDVDFRTDIYSLGCTLYHMLTGRTPYNGDSAIVVMMKHVNESPPAIFKSWPTCPIFLGRLVGKMLAKQRHERAASYEDLVAELMAVHDKLAQPEAAPPVAASPAPAKTAHHTAPVVQKTSQAATQAPSKSGGGNKTLVYAATAIAAVLAIAGGVWWFTGRESSRSGATPAESPSQGITPPSTAAGPKEAGSVAPAEGWKNLIPNIVPQRDGLAGGWKVENGRLLCATRSNWAFCEIPVDYKDGDYDLRFRVTRGEGSGVGTFFFFRKADTGGAVVFDYFTPDVRMVTRDAKVAAILRVKRQWEPRDDPKTRRPQWLSKGEERTVFIQVRAKGVIVSLDGEEVFHWNGSWEDVAQQGVTSHKIDRPVFGVSSFCCEIVYSAIEMREVYGKGTVTPVASNSSSNTPALQHSITSPSDTDFVKEVSALPAEQQLARVMAELKKLNPEFDGRENHKIEGNDVVELHFSTVAVTNISPIKALTKLQKLDCWGGSRTTREGPPRSGVLTDLQPLQGMQLVDLKFAGNPVEDLSPLKGMPLEVLWCWNSKVKDLSPLKGMPLAVLGLDGTEVADLSPLQGMRLRTLHARTQALKDVSTLVGVMALQQLDISINQITNLSPLRDIKALEIINGTPAAEFWNQVEAGKIPRRQRK